MRTKTPSSRINLRDTWYKSLFPYPPTSATTNFLSFYLYFQYRSIYRVIDSFHYHRLSFAAPWPLEKPSKAQPALVNFLTLNQIAVLAISINFVLLLEAMRTKTPSSRINLRDTWYKSLFPYPPTSATTNFLSFYLYISIQGYCFLHYFFHYHRLSFAAPWPLEKPSKAQPALVNFLTLNKIYRINSKSTSSI